MFEKLSMDSLTTTMTGGAYRLWDTAKGYFAANSEQDNKANHQAKNQDDQDDEKALTSLLSTDQQGVSWLIPHPKKLLMLASLGLAYYTHQASYHHNCDNQGADISYAINGMDISYVIDRMDFTSYVPFQTTSDWSFAIPLPAGVFSQLAMLYGASNLLSQSYQYNAANLLIAPLSLMAFSSFLPTLSAQTIETEFFKLFGGNLDDSASAVKITSTGDIVVAGSTASFGAGNTDALVAKFYANGSLVWAQRLVGNRTDGAQALALTPNDDIVVAGYTNSFGAGNTDALVAKLYANGSLAWARTLGGSAIDYAYALALTSSNDIVMTGQTNGFGAGSYDALVAKLYANGSLAWVCTLGGSSTDQGLALALTSSDDIIIAVFTTGSFGVGNDALVARLYANGSLAWALTLGGNINDYAETLALTSSDDIVVAGRTNSFGAGSSDVLLAKFDANGTIPGCNLTRTIQPTLLNWTNITNTLIAPTFMSLNTTGLLQDWTNISTQFITPQLLNLCFAQRNGSTNTPSSTTISTSVGSSVSNSLTSNISPSSSQGSANSLTGTSSSVFSASTLPTSSTLTSTLSASDISTSLSSTSEDATTTNNPSSASTSLSASQSSSAYSFSVSVSTTPITIEQGISTTLTSSTISVSGNVPPSQVIYTIIGNNPDIIITVNGLAVTQFTQEDVEGNFVEIALQGVTCGDDYSTDLQLEANVAGSNAPAQQASVSLVFDITTCSYAGRLSLFSYRDTYVGLGFWANNHPKEQAKRAEQKATLIQSTRENTVNPIRFRP